MESAINCCAWATVWLRWRIGIVDSGGGSFRDASEALNLRRKGVEGFAVIVGLNCEAKDTSSDLVGE